MGPLCLSLEKYVQVGAKDIGVWIGAGRAVGTFVIEVEGRSAKESYLAAGGIPELVPFAEILGPKGFGCDIGR